MSTEVYLSEQRISAFEEGPLAFVYHGFYVSASCWSGEIHPFPSLGERERFIAAVQKALSRNGGQDGLLAAALAALVAYSDETISEAHRASLEWFFPNQAEAILDAAYRFQNADDEADGDVRSLEEG